MSVLCVCNFQWQTQLYRTCENSGIPWVEDPTNNNGKYQRNSIRQGLNLLYIYIYKHFEKNLSVFIIVVILFLTVVTLCRYAKDSVTAEDFASLASHMESISAVYRRKGMCGLYLAQDINSLKKITIRFLKIKISTYFL